MKSIKLTTQVSIKFNDLASVNNNLFSRYANEKR
jgi:hypothetical protein